MNPGLLRGDAAGDPATSAPKAGASSRSPAGTPAPAPAVAGTAAGPAACDIAVLVACQIRPEHRLWGWGRFVLGGGPARRAAHSRLVKVLGSGQQGGFGLKPSGSHTGLFCLFASEAEARSFAAGPLVDAYRQRSADFLVAVLKPYSVRGSWSGVVPASDPAARPAGPHDGPVAALTRASIRPARAIEFWRHSPGSEESLAAAQGCRLAVGLGEAPLLRQATFSVWDDTAAMDAYARTGAHLQAIKASQAGGYFSESMFVRFVPLELSGTWKGRRLGA